MIDLKISMFQSKFFLKYFKKKKNCTILCKFIFSLGPTAHQWWISFLVHSCLCKCLHSPHQPQSQFLCHQHRSSPAPPRGNWRHHQWPPIHHCRLSVTKKKNPTQPHQPPPPISNNNILYLLTWTTNKVFFFFFFFYEVPYCIWGQKKGYISNETKCLKFQHATRCFLKTHIHSKSRSKEHVSAEEKRKKKKKKNITNDEVHSIFLSLGLN